MSRGGELSRSKKLSSSSAYGSWLALRVVGSGVLSVWDENNVDSLLSRAKMFLERCSRSRVRGAPVDGAGEVDLDFLVLDA